MLSVLLLALVWSVHASPIPVARTLTGHYEGIVVPGRQGVAYESFLGVPYARPPVNGLRFANPVALVSNRSFYRVVNRAKPDCIQKNFLLPHATVTGSEDCLYLNVHRPLNVTAKSKLPVIVYIHGGAFFAGSASPASLGPQYFMNTGEVIFVAMAYRLGALGFLSTGDSTSPGNFGLKDQRMALRWVRDNIEGFGGNPKEVTLMGVSAGATSAHMHMLSPLSKDLFKRCVSMSGNALGPYALPTPDPLSLAIKQADVLGIKWENSKIGLIAKLRQKSAEEIVDSIDALKFWSVDPLTLYRPVVEQYSSEAFLTQSPADILESGHYKHVPWIQGTVENDGAVRAAVILSNATLLADLNSRLVELVPQLMEIEPTKEFTSNDIFDEIQRQYLDGKSIINEDNQKGFIQLYNDRSFVYPMYKSIVEFVRTAPNIEQTPVYIYKFSFKGPISYSFALTGTNTDYGVIHLDDTLYLFQTDFFPIFPPDSAEENMTEMLVQYYVDFAVNGVPTTFGEMNACVPRTFQTEDTFCDYSHFGNGADAVHIDNFFDFPMVHFWDNMLQG